MLCDSAAAIWELVKFSKEQTCNSLFLLLPTVLHLSIFISVINQIEAQKFCFTVSLLHASTWFEHETATYKHVVHQFGYSQGSKTSIHIWSYLAAVVLEWGRLQAEVFLSN